MPGKLSFAVPLMATTSRQKLSRKALKQPDEFVTTLDRIGDLIVDNLARVIIGVLVLVALVAIGFGVSVYSEHKQRLLSEEFYRAINALNDKDYASAERQFSALARNYSGRSLGRLASFYLASAYLAQEQPAKARDALQVYLAQGRDSLFRQMALTQLGVAQEDLGAYREAHAAYAEAAQSSGPDKARAQIGVARTLALMGSRQGAIDAYQKFLKEHPFSEQRVEVIEALAQMGAPPEPPPPAGSAAKGAATN
jgi:predicted negative regulator of RcsB-dependent stress response